MSKKLACHECLKDVCKDNSYCLDAAQCYQSQYVEFSGHEMFFQGCIYDESTVPLLCASSFKNNEKYYDIKCCGSNQCNNATFIKYEQHSKDEHDGSSFWLYTGLSLGALACFLFIVFVSALMLRRYSKKKKMKFHSCSKRKSKNSYIIEESRFPLSEDSSLREGLSESVTSGSGSGLPLFVQRTLAKSINIVDIVGKGRYGEVWKGIWQGEEVAVKIFFSRDEFSWARETEIYSTVLLRHENILGFYGSDTTTVRSCTQLWIVTHFHPERSLFDYLQTNSLDHTQLLNICTSLINGLNHLHTEILGTPGKPAIAHRDVTSKNVLMKSDGACCIADLGLAVVRIPETAEINMCTGPRIGTKRYMSPEILNGTLDHDHFDSFRKADIYSAAIVMWEASIRCVIITDQVHEYEIPYGDIFPSDPSFDDLRNAISVQNLRPRIPDQWEKDRMLSSLLHIFRECWHKDPEVRLTSLRVKKNLSKIVEQENIKIVS